MSRPPSDSTVLEQICDALVQALDGLEELVNSDGFGGYFMDSQVRQYCFAELSGAANALGGEQREHCLRIVLLQLALLPFLNCPRSFAHVVDGVAELCQYARLYASRLHRLLDLDKIRTGLTELKIHAPEGLARREELDGNPTDTALLRTAYSNNTRCGCFA